MDDLTKYKPHDNSWMKEEHERLGDKLDKYYNAIFMRLYEMKNDEIMNIIREVRPENYSIFIKCLCSVILEMASYGIMFSLEDNATTVRRY